MADKSLEVFGPVGRAGGGIVRQLLALAIEGAKPLPTAKETAGNLLASRGEPEKAVEAVIRQHIALASTQGFLTNLGGLATLPLTLPANLAGLTIVETRMVACIAHLRGYDVDEDRVRTAVLMCLLGPDALARLGTDGLPSDPMLVATAPVFNAELDRRISEKVVTDVLGQVGGTKAVSVLGRRIPVVGGGVGAVVDGWSTWSLASFAKKSLADRRPRG